MLKQICLAGILGVCSVMNAYADNQTQNIRLEPEQQTLDISLPANATTGYQWFVENYDHQLLSLQNYRYTQNQAARGKVGVGGTAVFTFTVDPRFYDAPQVTTVTFVYQQPWSPGQNTSTATITVSSASSSNDQSAWQKYPNINDLNSAAAIQGVPTPQTTDKSESQWLSLPKTDAPAQP